MTSLVDSSAHLNRRCRELELSESCSVALEGLGLTSLGRLAYAVGSPSESASEAQYQAWFEEHLPSTSIGDRSIVKRLITEAQTIVCAELREQVTSNLDAATVRKVPEAEREARMSELRRRLVGLQLEGANEPSHHLLDLCAAQERPGQLVYIEPSKCASRIHEVTHHKPQSQSVHVESQKLVLKPGESVPEINPSSALQALEALRRRGIAMTFAGSVSYPGYDRYLNKLFSHLSRDPPPGMARITVSQIVAADKQVFVRLIEAGIRPKRGDDKSFPMDAALMSALESYEAACTATGDAENFCMSRPPAIDPKLFATLCDACDFDLFVSDEPAEYRLDLRSVILASTHSPQATFTSIALLRNQSAHLHRGIWVAGLGDVECPQPLDDVWVESLPTLAITVHEVHLCAFSGKCTATALCSNCDIFTSLLAAGCVAYLKVRSYLESYVISRCKPQGEEDEVVHTKTLEERKKGWARGPVPLEELPADSLVSRRFGLKRGPKTRLIDDLTMGGVNEMVNVHESPKPHGPDIVAGMLLTFMRAAPGVPLQGRAYDLRSAYRQLPVSLRSLRHSFVAHWNSYESRVEIDQLLALPFGASRSVYGFLRVVTSIWWIGCMALGLVWSVFFDDFVTASRQDDVRHTEAAATALFKLLGWEYDECDEKSTEFANVFKALGVSFNLTSTEHGRVMLSNTASRIAELVQTFSEILESNSLPRAAALRLRGRMQFCDSFLFGRASRLCLQAVTKHAYEGSGPSVPSDLWDALHRYRECLKVSRPHTVCAAHNDPYYLFTDACYEPRSAWCAGLGAVLFSSSGEFCAFFSFCLDQSGREALGEKHKKTIIFELEFLALVIALVHWKSRLANRPCVAYLDNNSTRDVAISGRGRNPVAKALASVLLALEDAGEVRCWYARVPSPSNVADLPSRELCGTMTVMGQTRRADDASSALKDCLELLKPSGA
ncbi:hypothetical protein AK812_SmicGene29665 [Symbiodinium microadriaticum]|uniref:Uncharacterized protein n=1 Tax=Symbiodinium microadriaticum TaxID=2951 RepID=A0A1Q9D180_SYMMI|nr:hypothetical protein AK812_SmicGene29665 [Symbiodinium microadriaticum]